MSKLEGIWFKLDSSWTNIEKETKVDVRDSTFAIDHNVTIVTILDLQDVAKNAVGSHGLDEIASRSLECNSFGWPKLEKEEFCEVVDLSSSHFVS